MPCRAEFNTRMLSNNNHGKHLKNSFKFDKHIFKGQHEELECFFFLQRKVTVNGFLQHLSREQIWRQKSFCSYLSRRSHLALSITADLCEGSENVHAEQNRLLKMLMKPSPWGTPRMK